MPKHERCVSSSPKQHWPRLVSMLLQRRRTRGKAENARRFPRQLAAAFSMSSPLTNQTVAPLSFASVGMTKVRTELPSERLVSGWKETAGPSTTLGFGRDDNSVGKDKRTGKAVSMEGSPS